MWKLINSPIVIVVIVSVSFFILGNMFINKSGPAGEVRSVYDELMSITEEAASDPEKTKVVSDFAKSLAENIKSGFLAGFSSDEGQIDEKAKLFIDTKNKVKISDIKKVHSNSKSREEFIYKLSNNSNKYLSLIKVNFEFYKNGELIGCNNNWISEVKILSPEECVALDTYYTLPRDVNEAELDNYKSDEVKAVVTSFDIKTVEK